MNKTKIVETSLVLTTGFLVVYFIVSNSLFLYLALAFGLIGIFIKPLAKFIAIVWFKLADILNYFVSKIVLGVLFFGILFPISILYRLTNKDRLQLKRSKDSNWIECNKKYAAKDIENIW